MTASVGDRIARYTGTLSRRASLLAIGALAMTGASSDLASGAAKAKNARRRRCKRQVAPCRASVSARCAGAANPQQCETQYLGCCDFLANCRGDEAAECFVQLC